MHFRITGFVSALSLTLIMAGCAQEDSQNSGIPVMTEDLDHAHAHAHDGHPETLGDAVHALTDLRDTVRDAFADGDTEAAHGPLHDVGRVLEHVSKLAGEADLSDEAKATVETNVEALLEAFGAVDRRMHTDDDSKGSDYKDVSESIDAAISAITEAAGAAAEAHAHDHDKDGDHEHGDHDKDHDGDHKHDDGDHKDKAHDDHDHEDSGKTDAPKDPDGEKTAE